MSECHLHVSVVGSSPTRGSLFSLKNDCCGQVVLCCFVFLSKHLMDD